MGHTTLQSCQVFFLVGGQEQRLVHDTMIFVSRAGDHVCQRLLVGFCLNSRQPIFFHGHLLAPFRQYLTEVLSLPELAFLS